MGSQRSAWSDDEVYVGHMLDLSRNVAAKLAGVPRYKFDQDENLGVDEDVVWKTSVEEIPRLVAALQPLVRV